MPREIVLGNGRLSIALDKNMQIRDFFYPHIGLENHAVGHPFRLGLWTNGSFSWLNEPEWTITMRYLPETLVTQCLARNDQSEIELEVNDAIHNSLDAYLRKIVVKNTSEKQRETKLFLAHDFHIYGEDSGDTIMYEPTLQSIIHYKRNRYFLVNGETTDQTRIHEFAIGQKESFGKEGTWRDAEDGTLGMNPIAQGAVDSTVSFKLDLKPKSAGAIYYWIACGKKLEQAKATNAIIQKTGVEQLLLETENYWSAWVNRQSLDLSTLPKEITRLFKTSLLVLRTHIDNGGAIISSCDSDVLQFNRDTYSYVWPRDGAICAMALDAAGFEEVTRLFFEFCNRTITNEGYFRHKYWSDGSAGSSWHPLVDSKGKPQLPIQLDETALVLQALWRHFQKYRDLEFISSVYPQLVVKAAEFMQQFRDPETGLPEPTFDMWEEKVGTFTATTACVCSALSAAAKFARVFFNSTRQDELNSLVRLMKEAALTKLYDQKKGRFIKAILPDAKIDITIDSQLSFTFLYGAFDAKRNEVKQTMKTIVDTLWVNSEIGGVARYENDLYHRVNMDFQGNPWIICTLWLARWYIASAEKTEDLKKAMDLIQWVSKHALKSGILAEQLNPFDGSPISVAPLTWSHAEFVLTVAEYLEKLKQLSNA